MLREAASLVVIRTVGGPVISPHLLLSVFASSLLQFTTVDAGYTATDYIISLMLKRPACRWISATNADNIYGSQVVQNVLHAAPDPITKNVADMLLNPIDSRNFMWVGK